MLRSGERRRASRGRLQSCGGSVTGTHHAVLPPAGAPTTPDTGCRINKPRHGFHGRADAGVEKRVQWLVELVEEPVGAY
jgi:hypothetical protein